MLSRLPRLSPIQIAIAALAVVVALQAELIVSKSVNWDEFFHFSEIHQYLLGRPAPFLQAPFIYLYFWVPSLPGDDLSHLHLIRALILPFELATAGFIYLMARRFGTREAALISTLAFLTGGYVFLHGFALRADMIAASLLSAGLWFALCRPLRPLELAATGFLLALAFVATIKSILYAPAFLAVWLFRLESPARLRVFLAIILATAITAAALLALGSALPLTGPFAIFGKAAALGNSSLDRMFSAGLFPQGRYLAKQALLSPTVTALVAISAALVWKGRKHGREWLVLAGLLAPLLSVIVYRNAFPYFYAFILPPAMVATAPAAELLMKRYGLAPISLILIANAAILSFIEDRGVADNQMEIQRGLREIFPRPVVYIDESGMIGSYPRAVYHFASGWGLANYRREGRPSYSEAMDAETVPLLILNSFALRNVFQVTDVDEHLLPEDVRRLRANYIPHWGMVFVAGKHIATGFEPMTISIAVPGTYTVEGGNVEIDSRMYHAGSLVTLTRGQHSVAGPRVRPIMLRWGDHLERPIRAWPSGELFTDY